MLVLTSFRQFAKLLALQLDLALCFFHVLILSKFSCPVFMVLQSFIEFSYLLVQKVVLSANVPSTHVR